MLKVTRLGLMFWGGLAMAAAGFAWTLYPSQDADEFYAPRVRSSTFGKRGPVVLIDEAHWNTHKSEGRFLPMARLAREDGFQVRANLRRFAQPGLEGARILVTGNPLGVVGVLQQLLNLGGMEGTFDLAPDAFTQGETAAVREWVRKGGGLLMTADHAPCGRAAELLAEQFGVRMSNSYTEDPGFHDPESNNPAFLLFSRENGLLGSHPVTEGRSGSERVARVMTFTGQSLEGPEGSVPFLRLSPQAVDYPRRHSAPGEARSAAGRAQGIALRFGQGRVVVLGDTAMVTAQRARAEGREFLFGINRGGNDNKQLLLNILHWLAGVIVE